MIGDYKHYIAYFSKSDFHCITAVIIKTSIQVKPAFPCSISPAPFSAFFLPYHLVCQCAEGLKWWPDFLASVYSKKAKKILIFSLTVHAKIYIMQISQIRLFVLFFHHSHHDRRIFLVYVWGLGRFKKIYKITSALLYFLLFNIAKSSMCRLAGCFFLERHQHNQEKDKTNVMCT